MQLKTQKDGKICEWPVTAQFKFTEQGLQVFEETIVSNIQSCHFIISLYFWGNNSNIGVNSLDMKSVDIGGIHEISYSKDCNFWMFCFQPVSDILELRVNWNFLKWHSGQLWIVLCIKIKPELHLNFIGIALRSHLDCLLISLISH